jgi:hypothetical protein
MEYAIFCSDAGQLALELPSSWCREIDDGTVMFYEPDLTGTFHVRTMTLVSKSGQKFTPDADLRELPGGGYLKRSSDVREEDGYRTRIIQWQVLYPVDSRLLVAVMTWAIEEQTHDSPEGQAQFAIVEKAVEGSRISLWRDIR